MCLNYEIFRIRDTEYRNDVYKPDSQDSQDRYSRNFKNYDNAKEQCI